MRFFWSRDPSNDESRLSSLLPPRFDPFGRVQERLETKGLGKIMNTLGYYNIKRLFYFETLITDFLLAGATDHHLE